MKIYIAIIALLFAGLTGAVAQSTTTSFNVDGIKVIFKPTKKDIINARLYFRAGVADYAPQKAGIESFAIEATTQCGTKKYSGEQFRDAADKYSIFISGSSMQDYGYTQFNCMSKYFDSAWDLFTEAVMNPVFNENEIHLLRNKLISRINSFQSQPDNQLDRLILQNGFAGTPYATDPDGTEESLTALTTDELKAYYNAILNKNQVFLVVVGNIDSNILKAKIKESFAAMPVRPFTPKTVSSPAFTDNRVMVEKRALSTNYVGAIMNAPPLADPDYVPFRLGIDAFGSMLFSQLRINLHLGYDPDAGIKTMGMPYATMSISTTDPKDAVMNMALLLKRFKTLTLSEKGLKELKSGFITSNYTKQQSAAAITTDLGMAELLGGWQLADNLPAMIDSVTVKQINQAINKYIVGLRWSYLGNPALAEAASDAFSRAVN